VVIYNVRLRAGWSLMLLLGLTPLWWALGMGAMVWVLAAVPMLFWLWVRPEVLVPPGFGWWLLFLGLMLASVVKLDTSERLIPFAYRGAVYIAATIMLLYVYNERRQTLPGARVLGMLATLWCTVVAFGLLALVVPALEFRSVVEAILPRGVASNSFVHDLVRPSVAQVHVFLGYPVPRPRAPFTYTNQWGSMLALLTPFYVLWVQRRPMRWMRLLGWSVLAVAVVPAALSLNRGLWLSGAVALGYIVLRSGLSGRFGLLRGLTLITGLTAAVLVLTPVGDVVSDRLEQGHSDAGRTKVYEQAAEGALDSPLLGHGAPRPLSGGVEGRRVGTHGQLWLILFSHGFLALASFLAWFVAVLWRTRSIDGGIGLACHLCVLIGVVQMPVYELLPSQVPLMMVASGLALRELSARAPGHVVPLPVQVRS
jgi:polysaccharide biosynthesis protein PslJ